ncbi:MAG: T9SS type A sorting domain-containing protein [Ignavibacteria bacterium]|nr:T9SS type A sorting domain-containing protein [Ignavibacteria bacterium]
MKKFLLFALLSFVIGAGNVQSQTATVTVANFEIINSGTQFRFDLYVLRTGSVSYNMGSSTFVLDYTNGTIANPVISNQSPRYSTGNYTGMDAITFFGQQVALQINYVSGPGVEVLADPGVTGYGERVATLTLDILQAVQSQVTWDESSSAIVTPTFLPIVTSTYNGNYNGTLPVELSSFNAVTANNSVTLKWSTSGERNNSGFEIERKNAGSADWSKVGFVNGAGNSTQNVDYSFKDIALNIGKYNYRLKQVDFNGNYEYFGLQNEVEIGVPQKFELSQNFPNPFNPSTKITFAIPADARVTLEIYDMSGRLVSRLLNNELKTANYYTVDFNASNLSSGMYFYSLRSGSFSDTKKMLLVK